MHDALDLLYVTYLADRDSRWKQRMVRAGIGVRCRLKLLEHRFSKDKRLIKGPGAPALNSNQTAMLRPAAQREAG
jgi:hypothetical protein